MLGETDENWQTCIERTLELAPDSVTIYQMELPYNTTISRDLKKGTGRFTEQVADWSTKRRWVQEAFEALERAGYHIGSAYTAVKDPSRASSSIAIGCGRRGLAGLGVASFGHINGVHMQNLDTWETYSAAIGAARCRSRAPTSHPRGAMIREFVLQLKKGSIGPRTSARNTASTCSSASAISSRRSPPKATCARRRESCADARRPAARGHSAAPFLPAAAPAIRYT